MDPVSILLGLGGKLIDNLFPDKQQADIAKLELLRLQQTGELAEMTAQTDTNKIEAAHPSLFVSGGRPFIMWVCGIGCAWNWILLPVVKVLLTLKGIQMDLAPADLSEMMPVLMGMLGLSAFRTYEKTRGVASK